MKNLIKLINHTLFVEGAEDRDTVFNILMETDNPLALMFQKAGVLALDTKDRGILNVPFRKIRLSDRHITVAPMMYDDGGVGRKGVGIGLPSDSMRLYSAWEASKVGMTYNWDTFLKDYLKDIEEVGSLLMSHVDKVRINGMIAQVITNPLVGEDEVGLNQGTMKKLHKELTDIYPELADHKTLEGMWVLLERYPVVGVEGARWVKLVLIKGGPSDKLMVNPKTWLECHDGDEDGDGGAIGVQDEITFGELAPAPVLPALVMRDNNEVIEKKATDPVETVMGFLARELVGPQHTLFHGIARAAAVHTAGLETDTDKKWVTFGNTTKKVFDIYRPLAEGTFNARKMENGVKAFMDITHQNEIHLKGGRVDEKVYFPLLNEKQQRNFSKLMEMIGHSTQLAKGTAFGRWLMTGRKSKTMAFGDLIDDMVDFGIEPANMIKTFQDDALGKNICHLPMPQPGKPRKARWELKLDVAQPTGLKSLFEGITFNGQSVLKVIEYNAMDGGMIEVKVRLIPVWAQGMDCPMITIMVPAMDEVGTDGHRLMSLPGMNTRMFCPIFRLVGDEVVKVNHSLWFAEVIKTGIESFSKKSGKMRKDRLQSHMDRHIRKAVHDLVTITADEKGVREQLIRMSEFRTDIGETKSISDRWAKMEKILTILNEMGFDICTTSKNKPGTIVTKAWKHGIPRFMFAVNPFAQDLDMKRRVEVREIRKALELANPIAAPIKAVGCALPPVLAKCVTMLNVAVMDLPGYNWFEGSDEEFCFDTLLVTGSAMEKLALKALYFRATSKEQLDQIKAKLVRDGFNTEDIKVEEIIEAHGDGLSSIAYEIVAVGTVVDSGKIKACVGPIKGVMNRLPFKMFSMDENGNEVEIDLIVPANTIARKRGVDAVKYMMAANAGITEIDPDNQPDLPVIKKTIVLEDGTVLGEAISGPLPFFRPTQTGRSTFDIRTGERGIKVHHHAMIMSAGEMSIDYSSTPAWVSQDFEEIINVRKGVNTMIGDAAFGN